MQFTLLGLKTNEHMTPIWSLLHLHQDNAKYHNNFVLAPASHVPCAIATKWS